MPSLARLVGVSRLQLQLFLGPKTSPLIFALVPAWGFWFTSRLARMGISVHRRFVFQATPAENVHTKYGSFSGLRSSFLRPDRDVRAGMDLYIRYGGFSPASKGPAMLSQPKHWSGSRRICRTCSAAPVNTRGYKRTDRRWRWAGCLVPLGTRLSKYSLMNLYNTDGSFMCTCHCGYTGDGVSCMQWVTLWNRDSFV